MDITKFDTGQIPEPDPIELPSDVMRYQVFETDSEAETWSANHPGMFGISTEQ